MTVPLLLVHGDDGFGLDQVVAGFATTVGADDRVEIVAERSPDEAAIDRAGLESGSVGLFGTRLAVLRQPLRAAGRSTAATERLLALVQRPAGRCRPGAGRRPLHTRCHAAAAVAGQAGGGGQGTRRRGGRAHGAAARRAAAWIRRHATEMEATLEPRRPPRWPSGRRGGGRVGRRAREQTRIADGELRKLATYAGDRPISVEDVEALVADTRPASLFAITNAIDRRDALAAGESVERALAEGQPVLRILGALQGRLSDLIVARDLAARGAAPADITKRVGRGNARMAERLVEAARRYTGEELEAMLKGLFEADLAIKTNATEPEPALVAWLGEFVIGMPRERQAAGRP